GVCLDLGIARARLHSLFRAGQGFGRLCEDAWSGSLISAVREAGLGSRIALEAIEQVAAASHEAETDRSTVLGDLYVQDTCYRPTGDPGLCDPGCWIRGYLITWARKLVLLRPISYRPATELVYSLG